MKNPIVAEVYYVHPALATIDNLPAIQLAAEVERDGIKTLETFQVKCNTKNQALKQLDAWQKMITKHGHVTIINAGGIPQYK